MYTHTHAHSVASPHCTKPRVVQGSLDPASIWMLKVMVTPVQEPNGRFQVCRECENLGNQDVQLVSTMKTWGLKHQEVGFQPQQFLGFEHDGSAWVKCRLISCCTCTFGHCRQCAFSRFSMMFFFRRKADLRYQNTLRYQPLTSSEMQSAQIPWLPATGQVDRFQHGCDWSKSDQRSTWKTFVSGATIAGGWCHVAW